MNAFPVLLTIYFCSGVAALTLQVVWFKQLQFVLGSSALSASTCVASFFFGLSVGSIIGGRWWARMGHPLRLYAALEVLLAAAAVAVTLCLKYWASWIGIFGTLLSPGSAVALPLSVAVALAVLLPATLLMGATLPIIAGWAVNHSTDIARRVGLLYAVNTFGAAVGCACVGYFGIEILGVTGSALAAAGLDIVIGLAALRLASRPRGQITEPAPAADD